MAGARMQVLRFSQRHTLFRISGSASIIGIPIGAAPSARTPSAAVVTSSRPRSVISFPRGIDGAICRAHRDRAYALLVTQLVGNYAHLQDYRRHLPLREPGSGADRTSSPNSDAAPRRSL